MPLPYGKGEGYRDVERLFGREFLRERGEGGYGAYGARRRGVQERVTA